MFITDKTFLLVRIQTRHFKLFLTSDELRIRDFMLNSPQQRAIFNTKNYMLLRHKDSYAAPLAKTVFSLPFVVICNSAK